MALTTSGPDTDLAWPFPSWASLFLPMAMRWPLSVTHMVWWGPMATSTMGWLRRALTRVGVRTLSTCWERKATLVSSRPSRLYLRWRDWETFNSN